MVKNSPVTIRRNSARRTGKNNAQTALAPNKAESTQPNEWVLDKVIGSGVDALAIRDFFIGNRVFRDGQITAIFNRNKQVVIFTDSSGSRPVTIAEFLRRIGAPAFESTEGTGSVGGVLGLVDDIIDALREKEAEEKEVARRAKEGERGGWFGWLRG